MDLKGLGGISLDFGRFEVSVDLEWVSEFEGIWNGSGGLKIVFIGFGRVS